jgi:hypothetical protein
MLLMDRWKCGHIVPIWTFRRFELRQNGTLAYYKGHKLKGKIRLRGCNVIPTEELDFQVGDHPHFILSCIDSEMGWEYHYYC